MNKAKSLIRLIDESNKFSLPDFVAELVGNMIVFDVSLSDWSVSLENGLEVRADPNSNKVILFDRKDKSGLRLKLLMDRLKVRNVNWISPNKVELEGVSEKDLVKNIKAVYRR